MGKYTGSAPIYLSTLDATGFIDYEVLVFHIKATGLDDLIDSNPKALSANEIILNINTKFRYLKSQGMWGPSEEKQLHTEGDLDGLNMEMNKLVGSHKRGQTGGNGQSQYCKAWRVNPVRIESWESF